MDAMTRNEKYELLKLAIQQGMLTAVLSGDCLIFVDTVDPDQGVILGPESNWEGQLISIDEYLELRSLCKEQDLPVGRLS